MWFLILKTSNCSSQISEFRALIRIRVIVVVSSIVHFLPPTKSAHAPLERGSIKSRHTGCLLFPWQKCERADWRPRRSRELIEICIFLFPVPMQRPRKIKGEDSAIDLGCNVKNFGKLSFLMKANKSWFYSSWFKAIWVKCAQKQLHEPNGKRIIGYMWGESRWTV